MHSGPSHSLFPPHDQMRYKKRDYSLFASLSDKAIVKANSKVHAALTLLIIIGNNFGCYTFSPTKRSWSSI